MKLSDIKAEAEKDLKIDETQLDREAINIPILHDKYLKMFVDESILLNKLKSNKKKLWLEKWLYYMGKADAKVYKDKPFDLKVLRTDVNMFIEGDDEIQHLVDRLNIQQRKVDYLEKTLNQINQKSWNIKNAIAFMQFTQGGL